MKNKYLLGEKKSFRRADSKEGRRANTMHAQRRTEEEDETRGEPIPQELQFTIPIIGGIRPLTSTSY